MAKGRLALAAAVLAWALGMSGSDTQAQESVRSEQCTRELARSAFEAIDPADVSTQRAIANTCREVGASARGVQAARARFYAGRAYSRVPDGVGEAVRQLEIAVNAGPDFGRAFEAELRASRLELAQAYRTSDRRDMARNVLSHPSLSPGDPAVAYQRAMLSLADLGPVGQDSAFDTLKPIFVQSDEQLRTAGLTPVEIRRGRAWLYALGTRLGQETLNKPARDLEQRRADALRAIELLRPVTQAISAACPEPQPLACGNGITATEQVGTISVAAPTPAELSNAFFQLGVANLKAAGLKETEGLSAIAGSAGVGQAGGLDCFGAQTAADAASQFQNARLAFNTVINRSGASQQSIADAHWGLGCTILANITNIGDPGEQQRQLVQASQELARAPRLPLTILTLARAQVLQGQFDAARSSYQNALSLSGANTRCQPGATPNQANRAELPSRIYLELARTRYAEPIAGGAYGRQTVSDLYTRTIADVANARPASLRLAESDLQCAVSLNYNNAEARLILGHIYLRLGADGMLDPPPFNKAQQMLQYFVGPTNGVDGRNEGLYLLSRRMTLIQQQRLMGERAYGADGGLAVNFATQAYNGTQRPEFRRQACLARLLFGNTREEGYCAAAGEGAERTQSILYEGMYWLRRGQREGGDRMNSWSRAIQAFNRGLASTSGPTAIEAVHPSLPNTLDVRDLLHYGERYVLRCTRLDFGDPETASSEVKDFFKLSGMPNPCGGPPS